MTLFIICKLIYEAYFRFPHFKILKAGMKKWVHKGSNEFITYHIELKSKKNSSELFFDELYINKKKYRFHLSREDRKAAGNFSKKEILQLNVISEIDHQQSVLHATVEKGALVLGYTFRNKKKYLRIKKLKEMNALRLSSSF
jgi:hypothetical protein